MTRSRSRWLAAALGGVALAEVAAAATIAVALGWSWVDALEAFVTSNSLMGVAFGGCGAIIAWHRPRNPIGWLFAADGLAHATSALLAPAAYGLLAAEAPTWTVRLAVTGFLWSWPWAIGLFLPLALLLFPDGRLPSRRWRPVLIGVIVTAPLFAVEAAAEPAPIAPGLQANYLSFEGYAALGPLWTFSELRTFGALLVGILALVVRYRRAAEAQRRQLLWLLLAAITAVAFTLPWGFIAGTPIVVLFAIPLIPVAVTVAIVRHQLLDIRLVVSRAAAWVLLSLAAVAAYAGLVALLDRFVSAQLGRSAVATVVVALLVAPLLPRLQRLVGRAMYGDRDDPARVASRVGEQLAAGAEPGWDGVARAIRDALRLRHVTVSGPVGVLAAHGPRAGPTQTIALAYRGEPVGELGVGLRPGERALSAADHAALHLVAAPLAVALHATRLSEQLQASRERIISAREEERRRLRRDLHDGLGPTLTGVALAADAAGNLLDSQPDRSRELLATLRAEVRHAIGDIRRLVENLRPPALDELGLVAALRQRVDQATWRADGAAVRVRLETPDELPALPAAIEVAAYRIANEALTNVLRHSRASVAVLRLRCGDTLAMEIADNGAPNGAWRPGVGLQAMRERAEELGGQFNAGPSPDGGLVSVSFPLMAP
ncbi:MAG: histidine kinase [Micromonosporaceae bacterium]